MRLFTSTPPGTALLDRVNERISKQKRYRKQAKDAIRQVFTPNNAVRVVLQPKMPNNSNVYCYVSFCVIDALCNRPPWCVTGHLQTFKAMSLSYIIQCGHILHSAYLHTLTCTIGHPRTLH